MSDVYYFMMTLLTLTYLKKSIGGSLELQTDLDNLYKRCNNNEMSINIEKYFIITYSLKKNKP